MNIDEPLARLTPNALRFSQTDALGSIIALTDETGAIRTQYIYDPYGNVTISGDPSDNPFQYTGRENDGTGLYYYRTRYYSPELQRFISEDPIGFDGGENFYAYVGNNPINYIDPFGLFESPWYLSWVPGQHMFDLGMTAIESGNYGFASLYFAGMMGEHFLLVWALGQSSVVGGGSVCELNLAKGSSAGATAIESSNLAVLEKTGKFLEMIRTGEGQTAVKKMEEMAMSQAGRSKLLAIHQRVSELLPYAKSAQAANVMKTLQQISGTLARGGR